MNSTTERPDSAEHGSESSRARGARGGRGGGEASETRTTRGPPGSCPREEGPDAVTGHWDLRSRQDTPAWLLRPPGLTWAAGAANTNTGVTQRQVPGPGPDTPTWPHHHTGHSSPPAWFGPSQRRSAPPAADPCPSRRVAPARACGRQARLADALLAELPEAVPPQVTFPAAAPTHRDTSCALPGTVECHTPSPCCEPLKAGADPICSSPQLHEGPAAANEH